MPRSDTYEQLADIRQNKREQRARDAFPLSSFSLAFAAFHRRSADAIVSSVSALWQIVSRSSNIDLTRVNVVSMARTSPGRMNRADNAETRNPSNITSSKPFVSASVVFIASFISS